MYFKFFQQICGVKEPPKTYGAIVRCCLRSWDSFMLRSPFQKLLSPCAGIPTQGPYAIHQPRARSMESAAIMPLHRAQLYSLVIQVFWSLPSFTILPEELSPEA